MPIKITIISTGIVPRISPIEIVNLKKVAFKFVARQWHKRYSAFKFTPAAARKYNYAERKTKNVRTGQPKRFRFGKRKGKPMSPNGNPLVWTGDSRGAAKTAKFESTRNRGSVSMPIYNFARKGGGIDMRGEFVKVTKGEETELARDMEKLIRSQFTKRKRNVRVIT